MVGEARSVIDDESWGELGDVVDWSVRGKGSEGEREREREGGRSAQLGEECRGCEEEELETCRAFSLAPVRLQEVALGGAP